MEKNKNYPLTQSQLGVFLDCMSEENSSEYNNDASLTFDKEDVDIEQLKNALSDTISMYPVLKSVVELNDGKPCLAYKEDIILDVEIIKTDGGLEKVFDDFSRPFDLYNGPLCRFAICEGDDKVYLLTGVHHVISDGTCLMTFLNNVIKRYLGEEVVKEQKDAFEVCELEESAEFVEKQKEDKKYFDEMLAGADVDSNIIPDEIDKDTVDIIGKQKRYYLSDFIDVSVVPEKFEGSSSTLFMAGFAYALAKESGQPQALFNMIESGRRLKEAQNTFTMMVKTLPVLFNIDEEMKVQDFLKNMHQIIRESCEHDSCSIVNLAADYEINSDIMFVYQGKIFDVCQINGKTVPFNLHKSDQAQEKLSLDVIQTDNDYELVFEYRGDLYLDETIDNFARLYANIIKGLSTKETLKEIEFADDTVKDFYQKANDNAVEYDESLTIVDMFRDVVKRFPDNEAILFKDKVLTYKELDNLSERLAQHLVKMGVKSEEPVGIMVNRSEIFPVCTLGVLKSGGACQPLDSNYPQERLLYMLEDSGAKIVIADKNLAPIIEEYKGEIIFADSIYDMPLDEGLTLEGPKADSLFTLIYTSGSTGKPKGCMLEHKNLVNFCISFCRKFDVTEKDRASAYGAFGFDASMQDLYPYITCGASVTIIPEEIRLDLVALNELILKNKITMMDCTTQLGRQLITQFPDNPYMRVFTVGGEKLVPCNPPKYKFVNTYGPTECTIYVTDYEVDKMYDSVPIGKTFGNCDGYIVDKQLRLLPPGAVGELAISGRPVIRGYLNRPDKNAEAFLENTVLEKEGYERLYLTGDVCRYLPDGNIQFVGRKDDQVKIRGFRIELTEIERRIREFEKIKDACVIAKDLPSGGKAVVAYVVSDSEIPVAELNSFIGETLPKYMIPQVTMQIEKIPLNPNGKVDKRKLPEPVIQKKEQNERPLNALEQKLYDMVSEITGISEFDITESLTSSGLTSLSTIMFSSKLYEEFNIKISVNDLMDDDCSLVSVENIVLDALLKGKVSDSSEEIEEAEISDVALCAEQLGVYYDSMKRPSDLIYNIPMMYTFPEGTDAGQLAAALSKVINDNPVFSSRIVISGKDIVQQQIEDFEANVEVKEICDADLKNYADSFVLPFALDKGPLFRAEVIKTETKVVLLFDVHHIIFDGLSFTALLNKLVAVLEKGESQRDTSYYNFIAEEKAFAGSEREAEAISYFDEMFSNFENATDIAPDKQGRSEDGILKESKTLINKVTVDDFCRNNNVTPAALFLAALEYTLGRCIASSDVYITMISNGREEAVYANSLGMFVKSLPIHANIKQDVSACEFIKIASKDMHTAIKNSLYPLSKVFEKYGFAPKINYACQIGVDEAIKLDGKEIKETVIFNPLPKFNLSIHIDEDKEDYVVNVQYNDALYTEAYMNILSEAICACAENMMTDADGKLLKVSLLNDEEKKRIDSFKCVGEREIEIKLFHQLLEEQARLNPDKMALIAKDAEFTYDQLNKEMNKMAHGLMTRGILRGDAVAVLMPRTSALMISMYAVMKAGGCYIPCDPEYPKDRIEYIIENSNAKYIITDRPRGFDNEIYADDLLMNTDDTNPDVEVSPDDTAYMIYTSGSTGKPKGVIIRHLGIANYVAPFPENRHVYAVKEKANVMISVTTASFDMSLKETAVALANGLTLVLASEEETQNPQLLTNLFERTGGDVFNATPSRMEQYMMLPAFIDVLAKCKVIMCGGEKYSPKLLERLKSLTNAQIFNTYGPTEITVSCNGMDLTNETEICVGAPLLNVKEFIVDSDDNLLPVGFIGELLVGGLGVSKGYLNKPDVTAKSFRYFGDEWIYKTGDYAKWTLDGNVIILGRTDNQVKLRGLRIELGEVERVILSYPGVNQVVVLIKEIRGMEHLCAYYVGEGDFTEADLKEFISKSLTKYMVPTAYMRLEKMPQTPNGKTDVKGLPLPELTMSEDYVEPATPEEKAICDIFAEVLNMDRVSATDSFFDLGGTSLTVTSVLVKLTEQNFEISYGDIFALKTPRDLATKATGGNGFVDDLKSYDYSVFDDILKANNLENFNKGSEPLGNVLITGTTGFLGIHILHQLLHNYEGKVFALLRGGRSSTAKKRLVAQIFYYFDEDVSPLLDNKLFIVEGDVTESSWFELLKDEEINTVINCAALVKHFSETDDIERINAGGVKNLLGFCKEHDATIIQISTGSVAGDRVDGFPSKDIVLTEQSIYFGQSIDNQYVHSKFMGERYVLEYIKDGGKGKIMRVGNLAARSKDGEFQINSTTNGFMGRLKAYLAIGAFPYSSMGYPVEMAPIDETADAILRLASAPKECCLFHPYNNHFVPLGDVILQMKRMGFEIKLAEDDEFATMLSKAGSNEKIAPLLTTLIAYDNKDTSKSVEMIQVDNEYTTGALYRKNFEWSMTSRDYMNQFLDALYGLDFFDIEG